jgi:hypothetical protein
MKKFYTSRPANFFKMFAKQNELDVQTRFYMGIKKRKSQKKVYKG